MRNCKELSDLHEWGITVIKFGVDKYQVKHEEGKITICAH